MLGHALPEMDKEVLDLVKVCSDNTVQDALAMGTIHQQKGLHLEAEWESLIYHVEVT